MDQEATAWPTRSGLRNRKALQVAQRLPCRLDLGHFGNLDSRLMSCRHGARSETIAAREATSSGLSFKHQRVHIRFTHDHAQHHRTTDQGFNTRVLFPTDATIE